MGEIRPLGLFAFSCLIACLTQALPDWLIVITISGIGFKFWKGSRLPPALLIAFMIAACSFLVIESPSFFHRYTLTGGIVLSALFSILSPPHKHRIMRFHVLLFSLLIAILVIPKETFPSWLYFVLSLLVCVSLVLHHIRGQTMVSLLTLIRSLMKLAIPLTLFILPVYFLFPETHSQPNYQGTSGMSGDLEPGKLASLVLSDRLAFRVRFHGKIPPHERMYWRAEVLERSQGLRWTQGANYPSIPFVTSEPTEEMTYELMLDSQLAGVTPLLEYSEHVNLPREGEELRWQLEKQVFHSETNFLVAGSTLASSFPSPTLPQLAEVEDTPSPRVKALVDELKKLDPESRIARLLEVFQTFHYTLQPERLTSDDPLGEFLFDSKKGFCEHFAASFATLLRYAGTPARVVIGYQGGSRLASSPYYQITNADAHAWAEVWIKGAWVHVDPSSVVIGSVETRKEKTSYSGLLMAWISFSLQNLTDLMREWSEDIGMFWILIGVSAFGLILIQIYRLTHRSKKEPVWEKDTRFLLTNIETLAIERETSETVYNFLSRTARQTGHQGFKELAELYNRVKFADDLKAVPHLKTSLKASKKAIPGLRRKIKS
ncbi:MAG: DUF3488 domain-containing protein [Chitinophagaceae bacterium]|nr:DUF3488 domain-containing protein [Oligoflexus sp.]